MASRHRKMLTVIIQTCSRPEMLRDALASVSSQTRLDCIDTIIVSENGGNHASSVICNEFDDLPIDYVFQDPPLPIARHLVRLQGRVKTPLIALLHDDDWWMPDHIETSLLALQSAQAIASFANFSEAASILHPLISSYKAPRVWAASGFDFSRNYISMNYVQNFLVCLLDSTYHFTTYVGDAKAFGEAVDKAFSDNSYDVDRTFPIFLGELGAIVYKTRVSAVIRTHPGQDSLRSIYYEVGGSLKAKTTEVLATNFPAAIRDAGLLFNQVFVPGLSEQELVGMMAYLPWEQKSALSSACGFYGRNGELLTEIGWQLPQAKAVPVPLLRRVVSKLKNRYKSMLPWLQKYSS